ncbi:hypothetical protein [Streptomyces sp. UNOC14_S4]|uniref:hypothetical protein n=1 Tax=Streptomyces sp. UNOC14_S4 TaxID=2872340 RepID=UPI001E54F893|nr:hypothetical protein [Streptomyces sp. UNOC14_S4]MCC3771158.1 hypothetical protein [Streptomyces sp. UNOC14_S4]
MQGSTQGPVLGPPPPRAEPDDRMAEVWTAAPASVPPGHPAALPDAWSATARQTQPAQARGGRLVQHYEPVRAYVDPSRPVPLQQAPLGQSPHP